MFLLDTNVVSELRKAKAGRANRGVTEWAESVFVSLIFISVISLQELERGVGPRVKRPCDRGIMTTGDALDRVASESFHRGRCRHRCRHRSARREGRYFVPLIPAPLAVA